MPSELPFKWPKAFSYFATKKGKLKTAISYRPNKNRTFSIQTREGHGIKNCNGVFVIVFVII